MQDRELYEQILGLSSPWSFERVDLDAAKSEVHVYREHPRAPSSVARSASENWPVMTMRLNASGDTWTRASAASDRNWPPADVVATPE